MVRQQWSLNGLESRRAVAEKNEGKRPIPVKGRVSREKGVMSWVSLNSTFKSTRLVLERDLSKSLRAFGFRRLRIHLRGLPIGAFFEQGDLECPLNFGLDID